MAVTITEPCGCVRIESFGHVHTKLCIEHRREMFGYVARTFDMKFPPELAESPNGDLL